MNITKINSYYEIGKNLLLEEMKGQPVILKRLEIFCSQLQEIEDICFDLLENHNIKKATNKSLDFFGDSVGQPRPITGLPAINDNAYRAVIFAKIFENISNGTSVEIDNILRLLGAERIYHRDTYPAAITLNFAGDMLLPPSEIKKALINATLPIEIDCVQVFSGSFGFSGNPDARGFGVGIFATSI